MPETEIKAVLFKVTGAQRAARALMFGAGILLVAAMICHLVDSVTQE